MIETLPLSYVSSFLSLGGETVKQSVDNNNNQRNVTETTSLKFLMEKVLERNSKRNKHETETSNSVSVAKSNETKTDTYKANYFVGLYKQYYVIELEAGLQESDARYKALNNVVIQYCADRNLDWSCVFLSKSRTDSYLKPAAIPIQIER